MTSNEKSSILLTLIGVASGGLIAFLPLEKATLLIPIPIAITAMAATSLKQSKDKNDE
jgi:hypothetical protein